MPHETITRLLTAAGLCLVVSACEGDPGEEPDAEPSELRALSQSQLIARADAIKAAHVAHPYIDNPVIFAGIANAETGMAHCYDEYTGQKCPGQYATPDCGGGVILAGGWDESCDEGGLGMFQFDNGTQAQTVNFWSTQGMWPPNAKVTRDVVDLEGNVQASVDFVLFKAVPHGHAQHLQSARRLRFLVRRRWPAAVAKLLARGRAVVRWQRGQRRSQHALRVPRRRAGGQGGLRRRLPQRRAGRARLLQPAQQRRSRL